MSTTRRTLLAAAAPAIALAGTSLDAAVDPSVNSLVHHAEQAHAALMQGDVERYHSHVRLSADFTLMTPFGGPPSRGHLLTPERWAAIGRLFKNGHASALELVQAYASPGLVVLVAIERTVAEIGGLPEQPWALRVTLVFRRQDGQWQLAHRHADPLVAGITVEQAAALAAGRA